MTKPICTFPDCGRPNHSRGLCSTHRLQRNRGQALTAILPAGKAPFSERYEARVRKSAECWEWQGRRTVAGYGLIRTDDGRQVYVHRAAWEMANEEVIPEGMVIDHLCHNTSCVNPEHLQAVTQKQNSENARKRPSLAGVRGVTWSERSRKWEARVTHNGKSYRCGRFDTIEEAGEAAKRKRLELFTNNQHDLVHP